MDELHGHLSYYKLKVFNKKIFNVKDKNLNFFQQFDVQKILTLWNEYNKYLWGSEQKILSLELHHKDQNQSNSLISNLQLLCPNCHRNK